MVSSLCHLYSPIVTSTRLCFFFFFFQAEDGIRDIGVTGVQTCALPIYLVGTFRCIAKSAKGMLDLEPIDGERGAIVNTASVAAEDGQMGQAAYSASKGGIVGMTLPIARDLAGDGIRINTILPGIFNTPLMQFAPPQVKDALSLPCPSPSAWVRPRN